MGALGAMLGVQLSALWLQREYFKADPEGTLLASLRAIGQDARALKCATPRKTE